jgi:hypothetical protein
MDGASNLGQSADQTFTTLRRLPRSPALTSVTATKGSVNLAWEVPLDTGTPYEAYTGSLIMRSTTGYIQTPDVATALADVKAPTVTYHDTAVIDGTTYYYSLFTYDDIGVFSDPAFISFTPTAATSGGGGGGGGGSTTTTTPPPSPVITPTPPATTPGTSNGPSSPKAYIPGCDTRTTGFSTINGQSCLNNLPSTTTTTTPRIYNFGLVTLRKGSTGEAVKELQRYLNDTLNLGLVIDGKLGPKTIGVIKVWQAQHGLVPDGLIGAKTKAMMNGGK